MDVCPFRGMVRWEGFVGAFGTDRQDKTRQDNNTDTSLWVSRQGKSYEGRLEFLRRFRCTAIALVGAGAASSSTGRGCFGLKCEGRVL